MPNDPDLSDEPTIAAGPVLRTGRRVFQRYMLQKVAGRGGMGVVWLAQDERLERPIALKFLPEVLFSDPAARDDLKRETRRSLELTHPHIVRIHDFVEDAEAAAISMEFVDGPTLSQLRIEKPSRFFEVDELKVWTSALCSALDYAHNVGRCVHRDLKPGNLMVSARGVLKVADFGIACGLHHTAARVSVWTSTGGTMGYMSPQQLLGELASPSDDIYSIGATLYELLTGKPPFYGGDISAQIREVRPDSIAKRRGQFGLPGGVVPPVWEETIAACLEKNPSARPRTASDIARRLGLPATGTGEFAVNLTDEAPTIVATRPQTPEEVVEEEEELEEEDDEPVTERAEPAASAVATAGEFFSRHRWPIVTALAVIAAIVPWIIIGTRPPSIEKVTLNPQPATPAGAATPAPGPVSEVPGLPPPETTAQTATPAPAPPATPSSVTDRSFVETPPSQPASTPAPGPAPSTSPTSTTSTDGPGQIEVVSSPPGIEFQIVASPAPSPDTAPLFKGKTPATVTALSPGTYQVNFTAAGQPPRSETVQMAEKGTTQVNEEFPNGTVKVTSQPPGAEVLCDGASMGVTPLEVELLPGKHEIGARLASRTARTRTVTLEANEEEDVSFNFNTGTSSSAHQHTRRSKPTPPPNVFQKMGKSISKFFGGGDKKKSK